MSYLHDNRLSYGGPKKYFGKEEWKYKNAPQARHEPHQAITSYGIILFTIEQKEKEILYLICQRRDSIAYTEFIKNNLKQEEIPMYINLMTREEQKRCVDYYLHDNCEFLWDDLWLNHHNKKYKNNRQYCCEILKQNIKKFIDKFIKEEGKEENDWGFSKGRKHVWESGMECALREFEEETLISKDKIQFLQMKPYEEFYTGSDNKLYRTVYYPAYISEIPKLYKKVSEQDTRRTCVSEEVSAMSWVTYSQLINKIDTRKKNIITDINNTLLFTKQKKSKRRNSN